MCSVDVADLGPKKLRSPHAVVGQMKASGLGGPGTGQLGRPSG